MKGRNPKLFDNLLNITSISRLCPEPKIPGPVEGWPGQLSKDTEEIPQGDGGFFKTFQITCGNLQILK